MVPCFFFRFFLNFHIFDFPLLGNFLIYLELYGQFEIFMRRLCQKSTTIFEKLVFIIHTPPPNFSLCIPERADGTGRSCGDPPVGFTQFGPNIYVPIIYVFILSRENLKPVMARQVSKGPG